MKYYVYRKCNKNGRKEYKKAKTLDIYVNEGSRAQCWQYSKQGAQNIADRENARRRNTLYEWGIEVATI